MALSAIWNELIEKSHLVTNEQIKGELFTFKCSPCGQLFPPSEEERSPKEPVAELWWAFLEHVREVHGEDRAP
jgi:hypothetical protein